MTERKLKQIMNEAFKRTNEYMFDKSYTVEQHGCVSAAIGFYEAALEDLLIKSLINEFFAKERPKL